MKIVVERKEFQSARTIGTVHIDGKFFGYSLEDVVRTGPKVHGKTAIPKGSYKVIMAMSPGFKRVLPRLVNVPGFTGVLIHRGNTEFDTKGCILMGLSRTATTVNDSKDAEIAICALINAAIKKGETVTITVQ